MRSIKKQAGMTGIGWLLVLVIIGFFVMILLKIGPVYLENYSVKSVLNSLATEPLITKKSSQEIKKIIMKRLKINGVYNFDRKNIKVKRTPGMVTVDINYTVQKDMVGNIDVLISFSEQLELVSN